MESLKYKVPNFIVNQYMNDTNLEKKSGVGMERKTNFFVKILPFQVKNTFMCLLALIIAYTNIKIEMFL